MKKPFQILNGCSTVRKRFFLSKSLLNGKDYRQFCWKIVGDLQQMNHHWPCFSLILHLLHNSILLSFLMSRLSLSLNYEQQQKTAAAADRGKIVWENQACFPCHWAIWVFTSCARSSKEIYRRTEFCIKTNPVLFGCSVVLLISVQFGCQILFCARE